MGTSEDIVRLKLMFPSSTLPQAQPAHGRSHKKSSLRACAVSWYANSMSTTLVVLTVRGQNMLRGGAIAFTEQSSSGSQRFGRKANESGLTPCHDG